MKLSDYVVDFLEKQGVQDVFLLAGGGIMHLLDSLARSEKIHKYYNLHEQASGFAAEGYAQYSNRLGVVFATTGPGSTNVITALNSAYIDSTPLLVVSGQVKTTDITRIKGVRQTGAQEAPTVDLVRPITKYSITVMEPKDIRKIMEEAVYLAVHGRPGTVWVDIPLDVQAQSVDPNQLDGFIPQDMRKTVQETDREKIRLIYKGLCTAKRPCILAGTGVILADACKVLRELVAYTCIPAVTSRRGKRIFRAESPCYYGTVGAVDSRSANYIMQNSDYLLVIGSGLRYYLTAYNEGALAPCAKKAIVNIQEEEIEKLRMEIETSIVVDAKLFLDELSMLFHSNSVELLARENWLRYCNNITKKYRFDIKKIPHHAVQTDGYLLTYYINQYAGAEDVYVQSSSAFDYVYNVYELHDEQDDVVPIGLGSMGEALPFAIGVAVASGRRVILGEGDGSLQHNIQELALLSKHRLPIKLFIENNGGYMQIRDMQKRHFKGRYAGCDEASGIHFPNLRILAQAYGIEYYVIRYRDETEEIVKKALSNKDPAIIEVFTYDVGIQPILKSRMRADGQMTTPHLEDMYPFVPEDEHRENMAISQGDMK